MAPGMSGLAAGDDAELDVLITGAGPVGMLLALTLAKTSLDWRIVGTDALGPERPIALSRGSQLLLATKGRGVFSRGQTKSGAVRRSGRSRTKCSPR